MKTLCIINPTAGKGRTSKTYQWLKAHIEALYPLSQTVFTARAGHAVFLARNAAEAGLDLVITMGGDGTVHEVINGLAGSNTALAVIPSGTGNDYARNLKIPHQPLEALEVLRRGRRQRLDLGIVNDSYFINMAGLGFDAAAARQVNSRRFLTGKPAYLAAIAKTLLNYDCLKIELSIDGLLFRETVTMISIANGEYVGGGIRMVPGADMTDGFLDICVVKEASPWEILRTLPLVYQGGHRNHPKCSFYRGQNIIVRPLNSKQTTWAQIDGEVTPGQSLHFRIHPQALNVIAP